MSSNAPPIEEMHFDEAGNPVLPLSMKDEGIEREEKQNDGLASQEPTPQNSQNDLNNIPSLEDIKSLILERTKTALDDGDPVAAVWVMHQVYFEVMQRENEALLRAQLNHFKASFEAGGQKMEASVLEALNRLTDEALNGMVKAQVGHLVETAKELSKSEESVKSSLTAITSQFKTHRKILTIITGLNLMGLAITSALWFIILS